MSSFSSSFTALASSSSYLLSAASTAAASSSSDPSSPDFDWCTYPGPLTPPAAAGNQCYFHYQPDVAGCFVAIAVFCVLSIVLVALNVRYPRFRLSFFLSATALMEIGGYVTRYMITQKTVDNGILVMTIFLVIAPNLFALVNYVMLGRLISATINPDNPLPPHPHPYLRWLIRADGIFQPRFVSYFFLCSDFASLVIQAIAASYLTSTNPADWITGQHIMTGGLAIPLFFFTAYSMMLTAVQTTERYGISGRLGGGGGVGLVGTKAVLLGLLGSSVPLELRNIYRFLEYALGTGGWVATHEWMFYVFDFVCVVVALTFYAVFYFGRYMPLCQEELAALHKSETVGDQASPKADAAGDDMELTMVQVQPSSDSFSPSSK